MPVGDGSLILQIVTVLVACGAVYGGIRSDLKTIHERIAQIERAAEKAHDRIDGMSGAGRRRGQ